MDPFSITNKITKQQYRKLILWRMYRQPVIVILTGLGIFSLLLLLSYYMNLFSVGNPVIPLLPVVYLGIFTALLPFIMLLHADSNYDKSDFLQSETNICFTNHEIIVSLGDFVKNIPWHSVKKIEESVELLLIFTARSGGEIVNKTALTKEQIEFIKLKASQ